MPRSASGVTLVELVTVVAIIAILTVIGAPSYLQYLQRTRRTEATATLLKIATSQQRFYLQNRTFTANLALLGFPDGRTESGYYTISVPVADARDFRIVAVPAPGSAQLADEDCQQFSLDAGSARSALPDPEGRCW
jgi:type IV pilus assembly protein PilE